MYSKTGRIIDGRLRFNSASLANKQNVSSSKIDTHLRSMTQQTGSQTGVQNCCGRDARGLSESFDTGVEPALKSLTDWISSVRGRVPVS